MIQQKMPGAEREKNQRTRHQLQKSKGQHGPDRHQGLASGSGCEVQVLWHHHRQQIRLVVKHWSMLQEREPAVLLSHLKQFQVDKKILARVYQTIIQSVMFYNQVCYFGSSNKADTERLDKVAKDSGKDREG